MVYGGVLGWLFEIVDNDQIQSIHAFQITKNEQCREMTGVQLTFLGYWFTDTVDSQDEHTCFLTV